LETGQKECANAHSLLKEGYEGMKQREKTMPPPALPRLTEALERLVQFRRPLRQRAGRPQSRPEGAQEVIGDTRPASAHLRRRAASRGGAYEKI
jgi:hypothetical protein